MKRAFLKMHGLGNDFVLFDAREAPLSLDADAVRALADRHTGIGCDQLIVIEHSDIAHARMRIFNADGGEVAACGNATRCVGQLLGDDAVIETAAGLLRAGRDGEDVAVDMGTPRLGWSEIPLALAMDTRVMPVGWEDLQQPAAVNVGNPHVIFFVDDLDAVDLARLGPVIETDPLFPERVNVNVAQVIARDHVRLKVWERGTGLTRACGTGACATAIAAMRRNLVDRRVAVELPGGTLTISWRDDDHIIMSGPATLSFTGEIDL